MKGNKETMIEILIILLVITQIGWAVTRSRLKKLRSTNVSQMAELSLLQLEKNNLRFALRHAHAELFEERVAREVEVLSQQQASKQSKSLLQPLNNTN
jgi:regulator of replication initiation timing